MVKQKIFAEEEHCPDCQVHSTLGLRVDYVENEHEDLREDFKESKKVI